MTRFGSAVGGIAVFVVAFDLVHLTASLSVLLALLAMAATSWLFHRTPPAPESKN